MTKKHTHRLPLRFWQHIGLTAACVVSAFLVGYSTSGDVHPFEQGRAADDTRAPHELVGDVDGNGTVDENDAIAVLEFAQELRVPSPDERRRADLNNDLRITVDDALRLLRTISLR